MKNQPNEPHRCYQPTLKEIHSLADYMRVFFRKNLRETEREQYSAFVSATTHEWYPSALLQAVHYLLVWSLEYRCPSTLMRSMVNSEWCWYGRLHTTHYDYSVINICSPTGNDFSYSFSNFDSQDLGYPIKVFSGEEYYAECLVSFSLKIGIKLFSDTKLFSNYHSWIIGTLRCLGLECPFITTTLI